MSNAHLGMENLNYLNKGAEQNEKEKTKIWCYTISW